MMLLAGPFGALVGLLATATLVGTPVFTFADEAIDESSGLVDLGPLMVTTNDSGDDAVLYVIDESGATVGRTTYAEGVVDVEALAPAELPGESAEEPAEESAGESAGESRADAAVWVADIGDNRERRASVQVYRVPVGVGDRRVTAPSYDLVYPDGPHDAESLVVGPDGRLRIISKGILGGRVYTAPATLDPDGPNRLTAGPGVNLFATDAALFPDGRHVLVRGYGRALVARFPGFEPVTSLDLPAQEQGEGVSIGADGRIRLSTEGARSAVLQVELPAAVQRQLAQEAPATDGPAASPDIPEPDFPEPELTETWMEQAGPWLAGAAAASFGLLLILALRQKR